MAQFALKQYEAADKSLADLISGYADRRSIEIAAVYALRNDFDNSMQWLERAGKKRNAL